MDNIGITEGMGKKIVEALKQQTNMQSTNDEVSNETTSSVEEKNVQPEVEFIEPQIEPEPSVIKPQEQEQEESASQPVNFQENLEVQAATSLGMETSSNLNPNIMNYTAKQDIDLNDVEGLDIPTNVAVLKQLITQLPTGVTRQTGAQIIKQTMEALGISMKSVLQEAQQVQESLNNSSRECQANVLEYKRQIAVLEKKTLKYQKQYAILNDIISLFIQTNNY